MYAMIKRIIDLAKKEYREFRINYEQSCIEMEKNGMMDIFRELQAENEAYLLGYATPKIPMQYYEAQKAQRVQLKKQIVEQKLERILKTA